MSRPLLHVAIRPLLAALAIACATPASAALVSFTGTEKNDTPPPAMGGGGCGATQLSVAFSPTTATTVGTSNFGGFGPSMAHCLTPPPTTYSGGIFTFAFDAGDEFTGTYSGFFASTDVENVLNTTVNYVVTGGTGRFAGATGAIQGVGILDRRPLRPINNINLTGTLDLPAVPEPATWAMMIMGFGVVGAMRRRRRFAAPA